MPGRRILTATSRRWPSASIDGRLVHLRDGGGGDGGAELGEMILELAAERFLDGAARLRHGERRQVVLQQRQLAGELGADDVGARRQELAELDVAGAEAGQRTREPRLRAARRRGTALPSRRIGAVSNAGEAQRQRHRRAGRHEADAVLREHETGLGEPQRVGDRSGHRRGFVLNVVRRSAGGRLRRSRTGSRIICERGFRGRDRGRDAATRSGDGRASDGPAPAAFFSQFRGYTSRIMRQRR